MCHPLVQEHGIERKGVMQQRELRRRRWIVRRKLQGWPSAKIAAHLRVSERTVLRWWEAYRT
ncbi:MAG: helix-turn-helix domain-containing protein, partial [Candidatus Hadarchaeota archaeon]